MRIQTLRKYVGIAEPDNVTGTNLQIKQDYDMNENEVIELMKSSKNEQEWNKNCDIVKARCNGYPGFWYAAIILSGIAAETQASW